jgi:hypothetical protein
MIIYFLGGCTFKKRFKFAIYLFIQKVAQKY